MDAQHNRYLWPSITLLALTLLVTSAAAAADAAAQDDTAQWQPQDSIRAVAEAHVEAKFAHGSGTTQARAADLDPRLKLAVCDRPLQAEMPYGHARNVRVTVRVTCPAEPGWRIHVPVEVVTVSRVVTLKRALGRGSIVTADDLTLTEARLGRLGHGYFASIDDVIGQRLRRPARAGSVLVPAQLETPPAIRRGQSVMIVANAQGIGVKMRGTALSDGTIGQIIDVENASSGRRIEGIVRSARAVEILLH